VTGSLDGILVLNKPRGISSAAALNRVKRHLPRNTKLGHAGTLDPLATGVLVALVGKATRRCEAVMGLPKQYEAIIELGAESVTDDAEGPIAVIDVEPGRRPTAESIRTCLAGFVGVIEQVPPAYSAIKVMGRRACDRVRAGQAVELLARPVRIDRIELLACEWPALSIRVDCGRGTYLRSLARDIGRRLGVGGYLGALTRTAVGPFRIEASIEPDQITPANVEARLVPDHSPV
jgi:tRNA pseudouridine55 synthase